MKNKGFTLVELLAVIIVLAVISTIVVTSAYSLVKSNNEKQYNLLIDEIEQAVKIYLSDNYESYIIGREAKYLNVKILSDNNCDSMFVALDMLVDAGLIKSDSLVDARDDSSMAGKFVKVYYENSDIVISDEIFDNSNSSVCSGLSYNDNFYKISDSTKTFVSFNNQIWRIIRINKDGSIRMILNDNIGSSVFGKNDIYSESYVLANLQYWYLYDVANISKDLIRESSLSLLSKGEFDTLSDSIRGTDEFWLVNDGNGLSSFGTIADNQHVAYIRPVIELKPSVIYVHGRGTSDSPYIIR